jgi:fumarylacetoacetase
MTTPKMSVDQPFTINNLPYGVISTKTDTTKRCATVLNSHAIDLSVLHSQGVFSDISGLADNVFAQVSISQMSTTSHRQ